MEEDPEAGDVGHGLEGFDVSLGRHELPSARRGSCHISIDIKI
jgi:hypothetical protein